MNAKSSAEKNSAGALQSRRRLGIRYAIIILALYFGFSVAIAFFPHLLSINIPFSTGFGLIIVLMAAVVILNILYMNITGDNNQKKNALKRGTGE